MAANEQSPPASPLGYTKVVTSKRHGKIPALITIYNKFCPVCKDKLKNIEVVVAIGAPHHCLLHKRCWQYFDYDQNYAHGRAFSELPGW